MSKIHRFKTSIYQVLQHNRDGSYETQARRKVILYQIAKELYAGGYKLNVVYGFKEKHIRYLNEVWNERGLSAGTIKNRNAVLRWLSIKINKQNIVPSNNNLGTGSRIYSSNKNKAVELKDIDFSKITNSNIYVQLHLQRYFGLRREESCKIKPYLADRGDHIYLHSSWCKGGRDRYIPIHSVEARHWLEEAKKLVEGKSASLIPSDKTYKQHREMYDKQVQRAGIKHPHGLRHAYAQERFRQLAGFECPVCGGPTRDQLTQQQKIADHFAREKISTTLGHSRISIVAQYCGK